MEKIQKIYIAREYLLTDDYGGMRIDEEAVFHSFEGARKFLTTLCDKDADGDDFLLFRTEIVECIIGEVESYLRKWTYNLKGELIDTSPPEKNNQKDDYFKCIGKYRVGDIVYIIPKIQNKLSPSVKGTYGVIVEVPLLKTDHIKPGKNERWREYTIYYITESGLLDHFHAVESALNTPKGGLPGELKFLEVYSRHLRKEKELPDHLTKQVLNDNIFVKNIKVFDFSSLSIHGSSVDDH